ncbi:hypothetical protein N752_09455 [Desulforamulus aquiferis]|nr:hypothetical protein [Desulforamulus aquiferis]RYD05562.1 hypothetical protein N752_09455 [Desulforamulus aquiferis]
MPLAYVIAGHHCGLPDWGTSEEESSLKARLEKKVYDYQAYSRE